MKHLGKEEAQDRLKFVLGVFLFANLTYALPPEKLKIRFNSFER